MYYVYVIQSEKDGSTYIGFTEDLERRINEHNQGKTKSIKHKTPYRLIHKEEYESKTVARKRELKLKKNSFEKEKLFRAIFT